jgi:hypothetical protein
LRLVFSSNIAIGYNARHAYYRAVEILPADRRIIEYKHDKDQKGAGKIWAAFAGWLAISGATVKTS